MTTEETLRATYLSYLESTHTEEEIDRAMTSRFGKSWEKHTRLPAYLQSKKEKRRIQCRFCGEESETSNYKYCVPCSEFMKTLEGRERTRELVRIRDGHKCTDCGKERTREEVMEFNSHVEGLKGKMKSLDVHHLNGLCGKMSLSYDKLEDMDGLITLCHKCHYNRPEHHVHSEEYKQGKRHPHKKK